MQNLDVFIPADISCSDIARGSGIAGIPATSPDEMITVYFEGNLYGAENLTSYESRIALAAGRCLESYPTIAKTMLPQSELIKVGIFDVELKRFCLDIAQHETVQLWIDEQVCYHLIDDPRSPGRQLAILTSYAPDQRDAKIRKLESVLPPDLKQNPRRYGINFPIFAGYPVGLFAPDDYLELIEV